MRETMKAEIGQTRRLAILAPSQTRPHRMGVLWSRPSRLKIMQAPQIETRAGAAIEKIANMAW